MDQNTFLDEHVGKQLKGLTFDKLIDKLNADVYGKEMRNDISMSVQALGSAVTELHDKGGSGSGVGWTDYQIGQLEKILKAAAYADTGIGDEINKLIASLRHIEVLTSLNIQPTRVTLNAGDSLDLIKNMIKVYAVYDANIPQEIDSYEIEGTLIPGKDCPVSISYTDGDVTVTSTITVTVRNRIPVRISARLFGNQNSLFIGTTTDEVKNSVLVDVLYNDTYTERTTDFTLYGSPVNMTMDYWLVELNSDPTIKTRLYIKGVNPESDPDIMAISAATIDYLLEGCSSSYATNYVETGRTFSTTITPDRGTIGSISVFVDGVSHPDMISGGTITINSIYIKNRSRIVISAINSDTCTVSYYLTNCTSSNTAESVSYNGAFLTVITPNDGYELDLEKTYITMGANKILSNNGTFSILGVTDNIKVYGVAKPASGGEVTLTSISASYTGGTVAAGTTLDQLKNNLTVTAHYSDGSTATITDYSLSGTLTAGQTNTITVTHQGKTATFNVEVEAESGEQGVDVITTYGRAEGYRISTSGGANSALSGCVAVGAKNDSTGIIPYKVGDVFYIKGITFPSSETNGSAIVFYSDANGAHQNNAAQVIYNYENTAFPATFSYNNSTGVLTVRINNIMIANGISHPYLRFSLLCSDVSQLKVMKNEVI